MYSVFTDPKHNKELIRLVELIFSGGIHQPTVGDVGSDPKYKFDKFYKFFLNVFDQTLQHTIFYMVLYGFGQKIVKTGISGSLIQNIVKSC